MNHRTRAVIATLCLCAASASSGVVAAAQEAAPEGMPTVTVTPTTDLVDHHVVVATGSGFAPNAIVRILQCEAGGTGFDDGCMFPPATVAFTNGRGLFSETFGVAALMPVFEQPRFDCRAAPGACELRAVADAADPVVVSLSFDPTAPAAPPPSLTVTPNTGLVDGQTLQVAMSGVRPRSAVWVFACREEIPSARQCPNFLLTGLYADLDGTLSVQWRARAIIVVGDDNEVDCRVEHCFVAASKAPWEEDVPMVPLEFDPDAPLRPDATISVEPSSGLQDGQSVLVEGTGGFAGGDVLLQQCLADGTLDGCDHDILSTSYWLGRDGGFSVHQTVKAHFFTVDGRSVDCRVDQCEMLAEFGDRLGGIYQPARAELSFAPASTPPSTSPSATPTAVEPRFTG